MWSLRETDLYDFSVALVEMDDRRVGQKFVVEDGSTPDEGQGVGLVRCAVLGSAAADELLPDRALPLEALVRPPLHPHGVE